ncbi:hypothetical protein GPECTOR_10g883 [Gonium pectorale]|uniref:EF-hand domain-containing protein n=1 Tax=Gonium pectorale TaxID=33097 RepID=A0A150GR76_GONPE|nr:hypothetical protein GPECTOR_10g883 [Gonium pectorale]|eukprot:KXZ52252.1 hypothetical protein GPECTOR_10g883 [Gonium pectorale]
MHDPSLSSATLDSIDSWTPSAPSPAAPAGPPLPGFLGEGGVGGGGSNNGRGAASTAASGGVSSPPSSSSPSGAPSSAPSSPPPSRPLSDSLVQRLQRFGTYGRLKQLALRAVASFMATSEAERVASLAAAFRQLDPQGRGRVSYEDVAALLANGDWDLSPTEVSQLLATFDVDADGNVDYDEWLAALIDWREVQESPEWQSYVNRVFDLFDSSHSGSLTPASLQRVLCSPPASTSGSDSDGAAADGADGLDLDECPFDDMVPAALREADADADGSISREEWQRFLATGAADQLEFYESRRRRRRGAGSEAASG